MSVTSTNLERLERAFRCQLMLRGYPIRISTANGHFFWRIGNSINRAGSLSEAVKSAISEREYRNRKPNF